MVNAERIGRGFDRVATIYEGCVRFIFGNQISNHTNAAVRQLKPIETCLIVGGGTGKILRHALNENVAQRFIYAEASMKMLALTKKRLNVSEFDRVEFITDFKSHPTKVDAIVFPFVLDCYSEMSVEAILMHAKKLLTEKGVILIVDFNCESAFEYRPSALKSLFIKTLYLFFKVVSNVETMTLPKSNQIIQNIGFSLERATYIRHGWIFATTWKLNDGVNDNQAFEA